MRRAGYKFKKRNIYGEESDGEVIVSDTFDMGVREQVTYLNLTEMV